MKKLFVFSVHYNNPALLKDHTTRLARCVNVTRSDLQAELVYCPIVHPYSDHDVINLARSVEKITDLTCSYIEIQQTTATNDSSAHGASLLEGFRRMSASGEMKQDDLFVTMDHDAHPLKSSVFAEIGAVYQEQTPPAGIGIPEWQRGHWYLHPSFFMSKVSTIQEIGPEAAFLIDWNRTPERRFVDTAEGFTIWCEEKQKEIRALRVDSTGFPWDHWNSQKAKNGNPQFVGEHGELVHVGHLMHYALTPGEPLLSHVWAGPLGPYKKNHNFSDHHADEVWHTYLNEPITG